MSGDGKTIIYYCMSSQMSYLQHITNKIVTFCNREAARTGVNAAEILCQQKKIAQDEI